MTEEPDGTLDFYEVLKEKDAFKLAILGHAALEQEINSSIAEAFGGTMPGELRRLPFRTRLALFGALTQMPETHTTAIAALAKIRHDFAHGNVQELTRERAKDLGDLYLRLLPNSPEENLEKNLREGPPLVVLVLTLLMAKGAIGLLAKSARAKRENERKALRLQDDLKRLLSEYDIA